MKKKIVLALLCTWNVGLTGCKKGDTLAASDSTSSAESISDATGDEAVFSKFTGALEQNVTLHILENDTAKSLGYLDELLTAFNAAYKDKGIVAVDANIDQYSDLAQNGPYGYGPDVLYQANDMIMKNVQGKHILPLPTKKIEAEAELPDSANAAYKSVVGNVRYTFGVPVNVQAPMLFYRKDMLSENSDKNSNGIPDMVESWNALYQYSKSINEKDGTKRGYMKALYDVYFTSGYCYTYGGYLFGNNNTDPKDLGFNAGNSYLGLKVIRQLASVMGQTCADTSIDTKCYSEMAKGNYFATMSTPDVTNNFINEMVNEYTTKDKTLSKADAKKKAQENLVISELPKLPKSGDLSEEITSDDQLTDMKTMGGINGYAISSYTKSPNASLAFLNFATSYEMVKKRQSLLGIAPCRKDVVKESGTLAKGLFSRMDSGLISLMPSLTEIGQVWTPCETLNKDIANDPYRDAGKQKYLTDESLKKGLKDAASQVRQAIDTLDK